MPAGTSFAQASDEDKAAARALATQGSDALKMNRFAEALDLVTRAEAIVHAPTHLLMIARAHAGMGKLVAAQETYLKLLHEELRPDAPQAFKNAQVAAKDELAAIEPRIASLRIIVDGAAQKKATVKLDDVVVPPVLLGVFRPVDPGAHVVSVYLPGMTPVKGTVDLRDAETRDVRLNLPDGPPAPGVPSSAVDNPDAGRAGPVDGNPQPRDQGGQGFLTPLRGVGIGLAVVGAAGVAVGAVFLAKGFASASQANTLSMQVCVPPSYTQCPFASPTDEANLKTYDSNAASQKTLGGILLPVGGVALGVGVALIIVGKPRPATGAVSAPSRVSVTPWFGGTSGGFRGEF